MAVLCRKEATLKELAQDLLKQILQAALYGTICYALYRVLGWLVPDIHIEEHVWMVIAFMLIINAHLDNKINRLQREMQDLREHIS
jgi:uncharacterized membrane protein YjjP (DUF1212 family)